MTRNLKVLLYTLLVLYVHDKSISVGQMCYRPTLSFPPQFRR